MAVLLEWTQVGLKRSSTEVKKQQKAATGTVETQCLRRTSACVAAIQVEE